mgnify:CR=1 FL=1
MTIAPVVRRARTLGALAAVALLLSVAAACSGDDAANPGGGPDGTAAGAGSGAGSGAGGGGNDLLAPVGTLDRMVAEVMETSGAPGVAVAVVYDDEVL